MCTWHRSAVEPPPKESPQDQYSATVLVRLDNEYPGQWFMGWYDFINALWVVTAINSTWNSVAVTHWATVQLPTGEDG